MNNKIHGHNILELLEQHACSREELKANVVAEFGEAVEFHTCHSEGLSLEQLLDFFITKEKVILKDGKLMRNTEQSC